MNEIIMNLRNENIVRFFKEKTTFLLILVLLIQTIPLTHTTELLDVNLLHRIILSYLNFIILLIILLLKLNPKIKVNRSLLLIFFIIILLLFISSLINNSLPLLLDDVTKIIILFNYSIITLIVLQHLNLRKFIKYTSLTISFVGLWFSLIGIAQASGIEVFKLQEITPPGSTLSSSFFAVEYIVAAIPFSIMSVLLIRNSLIKRLLIITSFIELYYLIILRGRVGYLIIIVSIILTIIFLCNIKNNLSPRSKKKLLYFFSAFVVIIMLGTISLPNLSRKDFSKTFISAFQVNHSLNQKRLKSWNYSLYMFIDNPIFGIGTNNWAGKISKYIGKEFNDKQIYETSYINPHNDYLEYLSENGIFSLIVYLTLIVLTLKYLIKLSLLENKYFPLVIAFISLLILSMFGFTKDRVAPMLIFYLLVSVSFFQINNVINIPRKALLSILVFLQFLVVIHSTLKYKNEKSYIDGIELKMAGSYQKSLRKFDEIDDIFYPLDPAMMPVSYYRGVANFSIKKYQIALQNFREATKLNSTNPLIINNLAASNLRVGNINKAITIFNYLKENFPNYLEPQVNLLAIYINQNKSELATDLINQIEAKLENGKTIKNMSLFVKIRRYYEE